MQRGRQRSETSSTALAAGIRQLNRTGIVRYTLQFYTSHGAQCASRTGLMLSTNDDEDVWCLDARGVLALSVADPRQSIALRRRISELTRTLNIVKLG